MKMNQKFFKCECSAHALEVQREDEDNQTYISIWALGGYESIPMSLKQKCRWIWRIIRTGNPWADCVILSDDSRKELISYLQSLEKKEENVKCILHG